MDNIMVFAPHPDDDIIGCGGSIARHISQGDQVTIVYMTSGEAGSLRYEASLLANLRENEARQAAQLLGAGELIFLRQPDGYLEYTPAGLIRIVDLVRQHRPTRVYLPHSQEAVPDHHITYRLASEGIRRAAGPWFQQGKPEPWRVDTIMGYEVWTPLAVIGCSQDISPYMDLKLAALRMHRTQIESIAYDEAVEGLNRYRGVMSGLGQYCECFQLIRASV